MSCTSPIYAIDLGIKENGKRNIKILPRRFDLSSLAQLEYRYGKGNILPLPCGKCLACKLSKAREWAVRCTLEASLYTDNSFITLTYDDAHLPADGKVHRKTFTDFIKRLRHYADIRYFGVGEYGSKTKRPHYHAIIFGWYPDDVKNGVSKLLEKLWPFGFSYVDECNFNTCQYVARYTTKKIYHKDIDGEFLAMSLKPGIGARWFEKHPDIFEHDSIIGSFGISAIPRYFEKLAEADGLDLTELKEKRIDVGSDMKLHELILHQLDQVEKLYEYKNNIQVHDFKVKGERKDL